MKIRFDATAALVAAILLVGGGAAVTPVQAAQLPEGSWRNTCHDGRILYGTLVAECRRANGKYRTSTAPLDGCRRFGNNDGRLFCEQESAAGEWRGSFRNSCVNERVSKKGHLKADCRRADGRYRKAEIGPGKCPSRRAGNVDGRLVCEESGFGGSGGSGGFGGSGGSHRTWHGSFQVSCRDASTDSAGNLRASCQKANGRWERAYLAAYGCPSRRAGNNDGRLVCEQ